MLARGSGGLAAGEGPAPPTSGTLSPKLLDGAVEHRLPQLLLYLVLLQTRRRGVKQVAEMRGAWPKPQLTAADWRRLAAGGGAHPTWASR